jgi:hypothetical protein
VLYRVTYRGHLVNHINWIPVGIRYGRHPIESLIKWQNSVKVQLEPKCVLGLKNGKLYMKASSRLVVFEPIKVFKLIYNC